MTEADPVRVETAIGWLVLRPFITEGLRPGIVACRHDLGRRHLAGAAEKAWPWDSAPVVMTVEEDLWRWRRIDAPAASAGRGRESGFHQNITFPVQPDPVGGMHYGHQKVRVRRADPADHVGDIAVDRAKARAVQAEWRGLTRPPRGTLRRPLWLPRAARPADETYLLPDPLNR